MQLISRKGHGNCGSKRELSHRVTTSLKFHAMNKRSPKNILPKSLIISFDWFMKVER